MTNTALERVRGLANTLAITEDYEAISHLVRTRFAGEGGWLVADCGACAHDDGPKIAEFIAAACNYVRSDEFDALVRDAMRYRKLEAIATQKTAYDVYGDGGLWMIGVHSDDNRLSFGQAIDAERGEES